MIDHVIETLFAGGAIAVAGSLAFTLRDYGSALAELARDVRRGGPVEALPASPVGAARVIAMARPVLQPLPTRPGPQPCRAAELELA